MPAVILFPAVDLRGGRCVRLEQGEAARETEYDADPREVVARFSAAGAEWIHLVDLDAAFGDGSNRALISEMIGSTSLRVQTGGGIRTEGDVEAMLGAGAARVVIGTAAIENPELVRVAVNRFGAERIAVGLDARGTRPAARGWREESGTDLYDLGARMADLGVRTLIYTDIERDGMLGGPNLTGSAELARRTGLEVVVSGGVASSADIRAVREASSDAAIGGVIVGKALYEGRVDLDEALRAARG